MSGTVRIDKWLWAVRLFKTRACAAEMCAAGKVSRSGHLVKAGSTPHVGDVIELPFPEGPGVRTVVVTGVIQQRVGAPEARTCYEDRTAPEMWELQKTWQKEKVTSPRGRPTKKNRRDLDRIRGFWD